MPTLSDARFEALRVLVPLAPPTTNDMLFAWLTANGGTGLTLGDLWYTFLITQGATPGHRNDMVRQFLDGQGFTQPSLNDAWTAFWVAGGSGVIPPGVGSVVANFEGTNGDRVYTGDDARVWLFTGTPNGDNEITNDAAKFGLTSYSVGNDAGAGPEGDDAIHTDVESEAEDFDLGVRDWYTRFWWNPGGQSQTGGNDFCCVGVRTGNHRIIRFSTNNNVFSVSYDDDGNNSENAFATFGASPTDSVFHEVVFERAGNGMYVYLDGVQNGATRDITGETIGDWTLDNGNRIVAVGSSIQNGLFGGTPKDASRIDAFDMKIGINIYGGVAPGFPSTSPP